MFKILAVAVKHQAAVTKLQLRDYPGFYCIKNAAMYH
jgi:hypothetical protein